jgi:hypothetical protein
MIARASCPRSNPELTVTPAAVTSALILALVWQHPLSAYEIHRDLVSRYRADHLLGRGILADLVAAQTLARSIRHRCTVLNLPLPQHLEDNETAV